MDTENIYIRWLIRIDLEQVLAIENAVFEFPWSEDDFIRCLRQRNCIGMVADHNDKIAGFMIYELYKARLHILNFAVHPDYQRKKVGTKMAAKLISKLSAERRNKIQLEVREKNLTAKLFFKNAGFRAISTLKDFYEDTKEDAYLFQYRLTPDLDNNSFLPINRISKLLTSE